MRNNDFVRQPAGSSIRVSPATRKRVGSLARRLRASSQQEVIDKALDILEHRLFWEGFDDEAKAYLNKFPREDVERGRFGNLSADGSKAAK
jgi:hypothetical protein